MPSFDIVSQINPMEIQNAVNQAKKEVANRFDFKGSKAEIILEKTEIKLSAEDAYKVRTLNDIVIGKLAKRGISLKSVEQCDPDISPLGHARQGIKLKTALKGRWPNKLPASSGRENSRSPAKFKATRCACREKAATNCRPSLPPSAKRIFPWRYSL